jgi:hypothetical protein
VLGAGLGIKAVVTDVNLVGSSMNGFALAQRSRVSGALGWW